MNMHYNISLVIFFSILFPITLMAQLQRDKVPLRPWAAPLYWQPSQADISTAALAKPDAIGNDTSASATTPANSLTFVGMTPCRVVDTRNANGTFGGPALVGGAVRAFPIQDSAACPIPKVNNVTVARAYSFNVTIVPPGFVDFVTVAPTPLSTIPPNFSTLNGYVNTVIANAAVVPGGTNGSVDVYASQTTHFIIDINGYYTSETGVTLAQGTAAAPSLSFAGDSGTGIFSPGTGNVSIAAGGTTRLSIPSSGNVSLTGNLDVSGNGTIGGTLGIGTTSPFSLLHVKGGSPVRILGDTSTLSGSEYVDFFSRSSLFSAELGGMRIQRQPGTGNIDTSFWAALTGNGATEKMRITGNGNVGIGTNTPASQLHVYVPASANPISAASIDVQSFINAGNAAASHYFRVRDIGSGSPSAFFIRGDGNVGIGTEAPNAKLHVTGTGVTRALVNSDSNAGLRLTLNNQPGWSMATVSGGQFQIFNDAKGQNAVWVDAATNNVGIGTTTPSQTLSVNGTVESTSGGFQFPDGTVQSSSTRAYTSKRVYTLPGFELPFGPEESIAHLDLPAGAYTISVTINWHNIFFGPNNSRRAACAFLAGEVYRDDIPGPSWATHTYTYVAVFNQPSPVDLKCREDTTTSGNTNLYVWQSRITAVQVGSVSVQ